MARNSGFLILFSIIAVVAIAAICFGLATLFVHFLWNALAGYFGFRPITFGIAFLIVLALSLIGSFFKTNSK